MKYLLDARVTFDVTFDVEGNDPSDASLILEEESSEKLIRRFMAAFTDAIDGQVYSAKVHDIEEQYGSEQEVLRVGDTVVWRGGWGADPPKLAVITSISMCEPGEKYGDPVDEMPWSLVPVHATVGLDNGHWAYGDQLEAYDGVTTP